MHCYSLYLSGFKLKSLLSLLQVLPSFVQGDLLRLLNSSVMVECNMFSLLIDKKGGALTSAVHSYMQHGDPSIRALVRHTLATVCLCSIVSPRLM